MGVIIVVLVLLSRTVFSVDSGAQQAVESVLALKMSAFTLVKMINPAFMLRASKLTKDRIAMATGGDNARWECVRICALICALICLTFIVIGSAIMGLVAVAVKMGEFDFLSSTEFTDWSKWDWVFFLALVNQLGSLANDHVEDPLRHGFERKKRLCAPYQDVPRYTSAKHANGFKQEFYHRVLKTHGVKGFLWLLSMDECDWAAMQVSDVSTTVSSSGEPDSTTTTGGDGGGIELDGL